MSGYSAFSIDRIVLIILAIASFFVVVFWGVLWHARVDYNIYLKLSLAVLIWSNALALGSWELMIFLKVIPRVLYKPIQVVVAVFAIWFVVLSYQSDLFVRITWWIAPIFMIHLWATFWSTLASHRKWCGRTLLENAALFPWLFFFGESLVMLLGYPSLALLDAARIQNELLMGTLVVVASLFPISFAGGLLTLCKDMTLSRRNHQGTNL